MTRNELIDPKIDFLIKTCILLKCKVSSNYVEKFIFLNLLHHCDLIYHLRSKVKVPNESPVMTSSLNLIVTICLSGTVSNILALLTICSLS